VSTATIDLVATRSFANGQPHDQFRWLRENDPVYKHPAEDGGSFWAITRHADVRAIGRDHQTFSNWLGGIHIDDIPPEGLASVRNMMLYMDPPEHHRYRKLVRDPFAPRASLLYRERIEELARQIVDNVASRGECDLVEDIAGELPSYVIADLLGIPLDDGRRLYVLTEKMHAAHDAVPEAERASAAMEMILYAAQVRQEKLASPADDVASALVQGVVDGEQLTAEEFNWFFLLLINAGGDTTRNAVGGGMLALFEHLDQLALLVANPDLLPSAVEEILRWVSPVVYMRRTAKRDTVVGETAIAAGDRLALYYGSANRDAAVFEDPDRFDVRRDPNDQIAFGAGPHFCLGANVARVEIEVMLRELLTRLPDIEPAGDATWLESNFISGPKHLPVRFEPQRAKVVS
jgi:cytochrome P450